MHRMACDEIIKDSKNSKNSVKQSVVYGKTDNEGCTIRSIP